MVSKGMHYPHIHQPAVAQGTKRADVHTLLPSLSSICLQLESTIQ